MPAYAESVVRRGPSIFSPTPDVKIAQTTSAGSRFAGPLDRVSKCFEKQESIESEAYKLPSLSGELLDLTKRESRRITGRQRYNKARQALAAFGITPSPMQRVFFDNMFGACAELIFKDDLETERDDLMLELGLTRLQKQFMAITPRRFGKTYSVAMFVVAMAFGVENLEQSIFSTGRRASQKLLDLIYWFMCKIPGMKESIIRHNVETIWIQGPNGAGDIRKISSYPSKVKVRVVANRPS